MRMSKITSPQQKKDMAYERDHYAKSEYDKARNGWRIKKHKARRSYRHAADWSQLDQTLRPGKTIEASPERIRGSAERALTTAEVPL